MEIFLNGDKIKVVPHSHYWWYTYSRASQITFTSFIITPMKKERKKPGDGEMIVFPEEASRCLFVVRWMEVLVIIFY